jgi:hypothetical protein
MKNSYLVATGIVLLSVSADSPADAIDVLKQRIDARRHAKRDAEISMSLVHALDRGELNFLVMDAARSQLLCGELNGQFQQPVTRDLADALRRSISDDLYYSTRP